MLIRIKTHCAVNRNEIMCIMFNEQTLKTGVFLKNGMIIESDFTFDETERLING